MSVLPTCVDNPSSAFKKRDITVGHGRVDTPEVAWISGGGDRPMQYWFIYLRDDCRAYA